MLIIKGAGNVVNGNEGIAGTMNIELIKSFDQDPGIPTFDASQIYAPIMGAIVYDGVRFILK